MGGDEGIGFFRHRPLGSKARPLAKPGRSILTAKPRSKHRNTGICWEDDYLFLSLDLAPFVT